MGAARNAKNGQVVNLDARRKVADLDLTGLSLEDIQRRLGQPSAPAVRPGKTA